MKEQRIKATIESIEPLTNCIMQLVLKPEVYVDYQAGQYLQIILDEHQLSYSIANAPLGSHKYELHIRHCRENPLNQTLFARIKTQGEATLMLPFGDCSLDQLDEKKPILFIAGGTGFAPVHAMMEQLLAQDDPRIFELYWGVKTPADLYMDEKVKQWESHIQHFKYYSKCSEGTKDSLASLVMQHHPDDLADWQIVISGPFDMVYHTRDVLVAHGARSEVMFSDAFSFER